MGYGSFTEYVMALSFLNVISRGFLLQKLNHVSQFELYFREQNKPGACVHL
jgi:hypothetical protein